MMISKRFSAMLPDIKRFIYGKVFVNWVSLLSGILLWFAVADLLEQALNGQLSAGGIARAVCTVLVCAAVRFVLTKASAELTHRATSRVKLKLRELLYGKLCRLGADYTDAFPTAEVVQLAGEGVEQLESYYGNFLPQLYYAVLAPVTLFAVFLPLSPLAAIVLFVCVPLIPAAIMSVAKAAKRMMGKYWDAYANLGDSFLENLQGLTTLKIYGADERRHRQMNEEAEHFRKVTMKVLTMQLNSVTIMDFVAYGGTALGSILSVYAFMNGRVSFGGAAAMILLASEFFLAMRALGSYFHVAMNGAAASERMLRLLDLPERTDGEADIKDGEISFENLSFSYGNDKRALDSVSFIVPQGSFAAVCGESGCGKSTLASVLGGMRCGYSGSASVGGTELSAAKSQCLRKLVTVVSTNSYIFSGPIRNTLLEGKPDANDEELLNALKQVNLFDFVQSQGGLDMSVSERGASLSGGQRQRLALARALLRDSPIYVFDEATSNIDAESEADIMNVIHSLRGSHTVVLISHRLANVVEADFIVYLSCGKIAEMGTHSELIGQGGEYAAMYAAQRELEQIREGEKQCAEAV